MTCGVLCYYSRFRSRWMECQRDQDHNGGHDPFHGENLAQDYDATERLIIEHMRNVVGTTNG